MIRLSGAAMASSEVKIQRRLFNLGIKIAHVTPGLMKQFDQAWRLFGTGLSIAVFGLGGLLMGLLFFPLMFVFVRDAGARQVAARKVIGNSFGAFIWIMKSLGVLSYQVEGLEQVGNKRNQLIIANHPTLLDVVFLVSLFPQVDCVIKEAVTKNPFMRSTVAAANYISNSDPQELLDSCSMRLESGGSLLLFPEGTRSISGQPLNFKLGAAAVAVSSGAEIVPIVMQCVPPSLRKHEPWYRIPPNPMFFTIRVMAPVSIGDLMPGEYSTRQAKRVLNDIFLAIYEREIS
jgi:1-acyl-sn-glycerol-3-phosphate acyltransferase